MRARSILRFRRPVILLCVFLGFVYYQLGTFRRSPPADAKPVLQTLPQTRGGADSGGRPKIKAFLGVQTGFNSAKASQKYNYELRRQQLRATWFPGEWTALRSLEEKHGIVARFVVGHSEDKQAEQRMQQEMEEHGDFLQLPLMEAYLGLNRKTLAFFKLVTELFDAEYILKVDDDVFLRLDRLPHVLTQWKALDAGYIGCMKTGAIMTNPKMRWYEPQHKLLGGKNYFAHTWGTLYVLSGSVAAFLASIPPERLRYFNNEDVTVGAWMLALNVTHYDDRRLCTPLCTETSVAVYDIPKCAGLCNPVMSLPHLWNVSDCHAPPLQPELLPEIWRFPSR